MVREARAILLAVKPQQIDEVLTEIAAAEKIRLPEKLFISIAAGITIARLTGALGVEGPRDSGDAECARDGRPRDGRAGAIERRLENR